MKELKVDQSMMVQKVMKLSDQAVATLMITLQKSLIEQSDIVPLLKEWELVESEDGLVVRNPPTTIKVDTEEG